MLHRWWDLEPQSDPKIQTSHGNKSGLASWDSYTWPGPWKQVTPQRICVKFYDTVIFNSLITVKHWTSWSISLWAVLQPATGRWCSDKSFGYMFMAFLLTQWNQFISVVHILCKGAHRLDQEPCDKSEVGWQQNSYSTPPHCLCSKRECGPNSDLKEYIKSISFKDGFCLYMYSSSLPADICSAVFNNV